MSPSIRLTIALALLTSQRCWRASANELPPLPDKEGFAGMFAGTSHGVLLAAGGANFPDQRPWNGGTKIWYDSIFVLDRPDGEWKRVGKLPRPLAYGISATHGDAIACIGGSNADGNRAECFTLEWQNGKVLINDLPQLPRPIANAGGALLGNALYLVGGQESADAVVALSCVYALDLATPDRAWRKVESLPGPSRILANVAAFDGALWVAGGAELTTGKDGKSTRRYLQDAYKFLPQSGWKRIANLPFPIVAAPGPPAFDARGIYLFGGDDGANVGFAPPDQHPGFRKEILQYEPKADKWTERGALSAPRVVAPLVRWNGSWVVVSGEVRPGVRSPKVSAVSIGN